MKVRNILAALLIISIICISSKCKKENTVSFTTCACSVTDIKYNLRDITGRLLFFENTKKWALQYQPQTGNYSYYFPCNSTQDSLKSILNGANETSVFSIKFSGKVKSACSGEDFGIISGVTTFDYIVVDSLKRN